MGLDARTGDVWEFENKGTGKKYVHRLGAEEFPGSFLTENGLGAYVSPSANDYRGTWRLISRSGNPAHDRSGCRVWCGIHFRDIRDAGITASADYLANQSYNSIDCDDGIRWCTARCRDLKVGPLGAKATPDPWWYQAICGRKLGPFANEQDSIRGGAEHAKQCVGCGARVPMADARGKGSGETRTAEQLAGAQITGVWIDEASNFDPGGLPLHNYRDYWRDQWNAEYWRTQSTAKPKPTPPSGIICPCCKIESPDGKRHDYGCEVPQPSAVASAPDRFVFVPSVSEWDLLPDSDR